MCKKIILVLILLNATGCSLANKLFDEHQLFIDERNSEIGKNLHDVLSSSKYYIYWEGNRHYHDFKNLKLIKSSKEILEYEFFTQQCHWSLTVDAKSKIVKSWKFISDKSRCKYKMFYEGPF